MIPFFVPWARRDRDRTRVRLRRRCERRGARLSHTPHRPPGCASGPADPPDGTTTTTHRDASRPRGREDSATTLRRPTTQTRFCRHRASRLRVLQEYEKTAPTDPPGDLSRRVCEHYHRDDDSPPTTAPTAGSRNRPVLFDELFDGLFDELFSTCWTKRRIWFSCSPSRCSRTFCTPSTSFFSRSTPARSFAAITSCSRAISSSAA